MFITDLVHAIPWSSVAGVATLLAGMAFVAAGLRYDRRAPAPAHRKEGLP